MLVTLVGIGIGYSLAPAVRELATTIDGPERVTPSAESNQAGGVSAACEPWINRSLLLQQQLDRLQTRAPTAPVPTVAESPTLVAPPNLPELFGEPALVDATRQAIASGPFDVELQSVDCTEYPCIVYGHAPSDPRVLDDFLAAEAFTPLARESERQVFSWPTSQQGESNEERRYFGVAFYPRFDHTARGPLITNRLRIRAEQMWEAVRHEAR